MRSAHLILLASASLVNVTSYAAEGANGHAFNLTAQDGDVRDPLTVERPGQLGAMKFYGSAIFDYADGSMARVLRNANGDPITSSHQLDNVMAGTVLAGGSVTDFLRFDLRLPVIFGARGFNVNDPAGQSIGGGLGSLRAAAMIAPVTPSGSGGFGLGIVPWVDLPTATSAKNFGYSGLAGGAKAAATVEAGALTVTGDVGMHFRPKLTGFDNLVGADGLTGGLAVGYALGDTTGFQLEANVDYALLSSDDRAGLPASASNWSESPAEVLFSVRGRTAAGAHWLAGAGTALTAGIGAPKYRIFVGGGFGAVSESTVVVGDRDGDGILDDLDQCPDEAEVFNEYKDDDGCEDALGMLTVEAQDYGQQVPGVDVTITGMGEVRTITTAAEPVPTDGLMPGAYDVRTMDTRYEGNVQIRISPGENHVILEVYSMLPGSIQVQANDESGNAIPGAVVTVAAPGGGSGKEMTVGTGGLGVMEVPPGYYSVFVQADGYGIARQDITIESEQTEEMTFVLSAPKAEVTSKRIEIAEKVFFAVGSANIESRSHGLLDEVANVVMRNADIKSLEIQGHTSSEGGADMNQELSEQRAAAVKRYLVDRGVAEHKLEAKGFGSSDPLVKETTEADRAKNRRVEFVIKKRAR